MLSLLFPFLSNLFDHWLYTFGGIALLIFGLIEKKYGVVVPPKLLWWAALICIFMGCFSAWKDEHKNVTTLINEKAEVWGKYNQCDSERQNKAILLGNLQAQVGSQQTTLSNQQEVFDRCVLYLSQASKPQPMRQTFLMQNTDQDKSKGKHRNQILLLTNTPVTPINFIVVCEKEIRSVNGRILSPGNIIQLAGSDDGQKLNSNAARVHITSPVWTAITPLVIDIYYDGDSIGTCGVK